MTRSARPAGRLSAVLAGVVLLTASLVACQPEPVASPSPSSASTPTATSPASPTPDASGASSPSAPPTGGVVDRPTVDAWVVSAEGIGPIGLGDDFAQVLATLPAGEWAPGVECEWAAFTNTDDDAYVLHVARAYRSTSGPVVEVGAEWNGAPGAEQRVGPRTADGLGIGSTQAEVRAAHPDAQAGSSFRDGSLYLLVPTARGSIALVFADASSAARSITVSATADAPAPVCG